MDRRQEQLTNGKASYQLFSTGEPCEMETATLGGGGGCHSEEQVRHLPVEAGKVLRVQDVMGSPLEHVTMSLTSFHKVFQNQPLNRGSPQLGKEKKQVKRQRHKCLS